MPGTCTVYLAYAATKPPGLDGLVSDAGPIPYAQPACVRICAPPRATCTRTVTARAGRCTALLHFAGTVPPGWTVRPPHLGSRNLAATESFVARFGRGQPPRLRFLPSCLLRLVESGRRWVIFFQWGRRQRALGGGHPDTWMAVKPLPIFSSSNGADHLLLWTRCKAIPPRAYP